MKDSVTGYADKIIRIIIDNHLTSFDYGYLEKTKTPDKASTSVEQDKYKMKDNNQVGNNQPATTSTDSKKINQEQKSRSGKVEGNKKNSGSKGQRHNSKINKAPKSNYFHKKNNKGKNKDE